MSIIEPNHNACAFYMRTIVHMFIVIYYCVCRHIPPSLPKGVYVYSPCVCMLSAVYITVGEKCTPVQQTTPTFPTHLLPVLLTVFTIWTGHVYSHISIYIHTWLYIAPIAHCPLQSHTWFSIERIVESHKYSWHIAHANSSFHRLVVITRMIPVCNYRNLSQLGPLLSMWSRFS